MLNSEFLTCIEHTLQDCLDALRTQLTVYPNAELTGDAAHGALKSRRQVAVRCDQLKTAIYARHWAHRYESSTRTAGYSIKYGRARSDIIRSSRIDDVTGLLQTLTRRPVYEVNAPGFGALSLPDQAPVELDLV
jgi:hypothetical protein